MRSTRGTWRRRPPTASRWGLPLRQAGVGAMGRPPRGRSLPRGRARRSWRPVARPRHRVLRGLSAKQLRTWATAWLTRVEERTGVRLMIYSGNHFWRGSMRNTSWFGRRSHPLWVAHWYVDAPSIPGRRWAGAATRCGSGRPAGGRRIRGPVDQDRVSGSLANASIASVSVRYPGRGGTIRAHRLVCGQRRGRCFRLSNPGDPLTLEADAAPGHRFVRWTGACEAADAGLHGNGLPRQVALGRVRAREGGRTRARTRAVDAGGFRLVRGDRRARTGAFHRHRHVLDRLVVARARATATAVDAGSGSAGADGDGRSRAPRRTRRGVRRSPLAAVERPRRATARGEDPDRTRFSWSSEHDRRAIGRPTGGSAAAPPRSPSGSEAAPSRCTRSRARHGQGPRGDRRRGRGDRGRVREAVPHRRPTSLRGVRPGPTHAHGHPARSQAFLGDGSSRGRRRARWGGHLRPDPGRGPRPGRPWTTRRRATARSR